MRRPRPSPGGTLEPTRIAVRGRQVPPGGIAELKWLVPKGTDESSFPPLLHGRVYADFRDEEAYFTTAFDLILSLYEISPRDQAVADLRDSLLGREAM